MTPELEAAMTRLHASLDMLERAVARHFDVDGRRSELETELQVMQDDRARLALDLESATAQLARMNGAVLHVGRRIQAAVGRVETVLTRASAGPGSSGGA